MLIKFSKNDALGHYTDRNPRLLEFQCGITLIYVYYDDQSPIESQINKVNYSINAVYDDIKAVIDFSKSYFMDKYPNHWHNMLLEEPDERPIIVYSIHYTLDKPYPSYEISFRYFPDDTKWDWLSIAWIGKNQFEIIEF